MKSACMETANNSCCYVAEMHSKTFARIHVQFVHVHVHVVVIQYMSIKSHHTVQ